jgi:uncharacterized protein DUF6970
LKTARRRKRAISIAVFAVALTACATSFPTDQSTDRPAWLQTLIAQIASEPVTNPPSSIIRYQYRGATVYYRAARCCDVFADLYNESGTLICHPDGGIAGNGDGKCADFLASRTDEQVIWTDSRR